MKSNDTNEFAKISSIRDISITEVYYSCPEGSKSSIGGSVMDNSSKGIPFPKGLRMCKKSCAMIQLTLNPSLKKRGTLKRDCFSPSLSKRRSQGMSPDGRTNAFYTVLTPSEQERFILSNDNFRINDSCGRKFQGAFGIRASSVRS